MNAMKIAGLLSACALLHGCGTPEARLPNPNQQEALKGVARLLTVMGQSFSVVVPDGQPAQCSPGKLGEVDVRTCKVCVVALYTVNQGPSSWTANVNLEMFDVAFKRGQSFDQPDISPAGASSGVWVAIVPAQSSPFTPPQVARAVLGSANIDYEGAARILGLTYRRGNYGSQLFWDQTGIVRSSEVPERLKHLPRERLMSMVGECPAAT